MHVFAKPEAERLQVLMRIPLALLLNIDLPKQGPGYLDLTRIDEGLARAIAATDKAVEWFEDGRRLTLARGEARISLPSDRSFDRFETARALLQGPRLPESTYVFWNQGYFDVYLEYSIRAARSSFALDFRVAPGMRDRLKVDLRHLSPDGAVRAYEIPTGSGPIVLDPRWHQAAGSFVRSGLAHILDGPDHLLFLLCLVLPFRRLDKRLVGVVTAFTVAHSFTLIAAAYGLVPSGAWFPPLVETLIAGSILYMAIENILRPAPARRWLVSGLFGLVHGFGFSFMLAAQLQFAGSHLLLSLLAFNVGIELGQLLVLLAALPALAVLHRSRAATERTVAVIVCALVAHTAWHWLGERAEALRKADWPILEAARPDLLAWSALLVVLVGCVWLFRQQRRPVR